ncbi:MAG TPA: hypothetical protein VGN57_09185 [Pirellulaceae bacterium]|jgi:hypothetical protein|nr:hypothetical protein [Pirellulaceae bacterium]
MSDPYQPPVDAAALVPGRGILSAWYAWLALNIVWGLLATFALGFSAWLLIVLSGLGRGLLY